MLGFQYYGTDTVYDILSWADYTLIQNLGGGGGDFVEIYSTVS